MGQKVKGVNSCQVDEGDSKLKGKQSGQVLVHKNELQSKGLKRMASRALPSTQHFPEGGDPRKQDSVLSSGMDFPAASRPEGPALQVQDRDRHIPAPDYPPLRGSAVDKADQEEKDGISKSQTEEEALVGIHPRVGEHGLNMPFPLKRSWGLLNEAVATEVLSVYFKEEDAAQAVPVVDSRTGWEDAWLHWRQQWDMEVEDAAVAEALAALEAASAGEEADGAD
ncbi:uncharacterized protein C4orf19-like [Neomonachus schauinslandi]|uniref:Uncharacterized protein C4orf19-like n=1 Tax=Neomonachus schauinslandi TaxID=29088 RepID=A0A8M1M9S4_NEOSC|nr:uncharacterized protein C4orf19-like [Neomonachus schauinslandi]